jgi:FMN phosphatase YigB (HAD superfamily)
MQQRLNDLLGSTRGIKVISTDVFDTLLLRQAVSQRSRMVAGESRFAKYLREKGHTVELEHLLQTRKTAETLAYRAVNVSQGEGEVKFTDIVARQLAILGLPQEFAEARLALELDIEKSCLTANRPLASELRRLRNQGLRVVAVSDTALSHEALSELIGHFHSPGLIDRVYSSAELARTKRFGSLFDTVLEGEAVDKTEILHIGDDRLADYKVPTRLGLNALHIPKNDLVRWATQADGAGTEVMRRIRRRPLRSSPAIPLLNDTTAFGREVFGPIVAQFCLNIWLYASQADANAALLFCARGGIGIREAFERLLSRLQLPLDLRRENILVSRLIAARTALIERSPTVLDELGREFAGASFADVAKALAGKSYELSAMWDQPFDKAQCFAMFDTPEGRQIHDDVVAQNDLFKEHLDQIAGRASRIILCDTGLYGSTQRLLENGLRQRRFETIQLARCNYKGLSEDHFPRVSGLLVEANLYDPMKIETVILRYWQIIESLFEPKIPSVRQFTRQVDGTVVSNAGKTGFGEMDAAAGNALLTGVLDYIDRLESGADVLRDCERAWPRLKQAITYPTVADMQALGVGARSVDFGRQDFVHVLHENADAKLARKLKSVKSQLWREGAIARDFPRLKSALLPALEVAHFVRGMTMRRSRT